MKKILSTLLLLFVLIAANLVLDRLLAKTFAQTKTSCTVTKVGSPDGPSPTFPPECNTTSGGSRPTIRDKQGGVCPVPGNISCGPSQPQNTSFPACNQGHCAGDYCPEGRCPAYCAQFPSTLYAADIASPAGTEVKIPTRYLAATKENHDLECNSIGDTNSGGSGSEAICAYNCQDVVTKERVWLQFHHSAPGSCGYTGSTYKTGDRAGVVWSGGNHTHVQIGIGGECSGGSSNGCVPADLHLPCN